MAGRLAARAPDGTGLVIPVRARETGAPAEPPPEEEPETPSLRAYPGVAWLSRRYRVVVTALLVTIVAGFSGAWARGALVLDGRGVALYLRLALDQFGAGRVVPYWMPELWTGAPLWAAVPSLPLVLLGPLGTVVGPEAAVKVGALGFQMLGAWGAFVLARSLWASLPASVVAAVLFALQPMIVSSATLTGSVPAVAVMATAPWLAWSLRRGLRGEGGRYVALAGMFTGFALVVHVELAVGLAVLGAAMVAAELSRVAMGQSGVAHRGTARRVLARAAAVLAVAGGVAAYRLLPLRTLGRSFVGTSAALGDGGAVEAGRAAVAHDPGRLLGRPGELAGTVGLDRLAELPSSFRLGWACLALTLLSVALLHRRDRDGALPAVLLAAVVSIWLTVGSTPLASGGEVGPARAAAFLVAAVVVGLLVRSLLRPLPAARRAPLSVLAIVALAVAPYLTPYAAVQEVTLFLGGVRFPQLHTVVPTGLALGAAYPVTLVHEWARRRRPVLASALAGAVSLAVVAVFLVEMWPSRSLYRVRPPATSAAYRQASATLGSGPAGFRVASGRLDPGALSPLLDTGRQISTGWPSSTAGAQAWRLTGEPLDAPPAYRDRALGLAGTGWVAFERVTGRGTGEEAVTSVDLVENPRASALVRTYPRAVVLTSREVTPELAVGLAYRNVGVVTPGPGASPALAAITVAEVRSARPCTDGSAAALSAGLASQLGVACSLHTWLGSVPAGLELIDVEPGAGAVFRSVVDRLQGVSVWLDRPPGRAELALHEVVDGGRALGPEVARGKAVGFDEYGLAAFTFDPRLGSAGRPYAFTLTCPGCAPGAAPRMVAGHASDRAGNLLVSGALRQDRSAAFSPVYDPVGNEPASSTAVRWTRPGPGRWRVEAEGPEPSLMVVTESWFPGWRATVDGRPAPVVEADGAFLGVALEPGAHVVTLEYRRPAAAATGRLVTAGTIAALAAAALRRHRPGRARTAHPPAAPSRTGAARSTALEARPIAPPRTAAPTDPAWDDVVRGRPPPSPPAGGAAPGRGRSAGRRPGTARWPPGPR